MPMIALQGVTKIYGLGDTQVAALAGVDLSVEEGEMVAIMGPSGSGKSTMMNILGCLDRPTSGDYFLAGQEVGRVSDDERAEVRNRHIGFVFQAFNLLPRLTAVQNVEAPLIYRGIGARRRHELAMEALKTVGLADRSRHLPSELSGGQQQRVAIARALACEPSLLLADEPTGALDSRTGQEVLALFQEINAKGKTVIIVTHDERVAAHCKRVVRLRDGKILSDTPTQDRLDARAELERMQAAATPA